MKGLDCMWVLNGSTSFQLYVSGDARDGDGQLCGPTCLPGCSTPSTKPSHPKPISIEHAFRLSYLSTAIIAFCTCF
ncbi:hypothetical protein VNO80_05779 [Phaseolus coccineus]|uniref:Uncharacterized protein n=1 Tax=Phaseolus coccineus TaxID=3886 RepID=A0AAN9NGW5_PHACN